VYAPKVNGYHPIYSIFQKISLHDTLHITPTPEKKLRIDSNIADLEKTNILQTIYQTLATEINCGFYIKLEKKIPLGGGLGGGSSDAATFLKYLTDKQYISTSKEKIKELALSIGSDVPFFLSYNTALVSGTGDIITPIHEKKFKEFLLILPRISSDTPNIYQSCDTHKDYRQTIDTQAEALILNGHLGPNDLKAAVWRSHPIYKEIEEKINKLKLGTIHLSGSGSTLFVIPSKNTPIDQQIEKISNVLENCDIIHVHAK
jgi:4-diphosphocytidyl-2-C-methyl-D-erythritol kinase